MNESAALLPQQLPSIDAPVVISENDPFDAKQRVFLNGLFAGLSIVSRNAAADNDVPQTPLSILFASQTGTAEALAKKLRKFAATKGFKATVAELDSVELEALAGVQHLLILAATCGDGEPPDNAHSFYAALMATDAPRLPASLNYSVCGLGDSSYPHFNQISRELDSRLEALGATRVAPLIGCDVDYDDAHENWRQTVFDSAIFTEAAGAATTPAVESDVAQPVYDKHRPYLATLINSECLSGECSAKKINHIEIALTGGGQDLAFEAGDALGLWPLNDAADVELVLAASALSPASIVQLKGGSASLRQALYSRLDLATITQDATQLWGVEASQGEELLDLLQRIPSAMTAQQLVDGLRPLQPRLYSISSSPNKHPGEVHLTVGEVHYELNGSKRKGVASTYLGSRLTPGSALGVYVQRAPHFSLPEDDTSRLIMIGPGTGIAPFRAFLEEREVRQASGANWLFFGDQHEESDYLYRHQLNQWTKSGLLSQLSLAWSRDSQQKVYVQDLIHQQAAEFFHWLEDGASIYICGDAARMAPDVERAMLDVIAAQGDLDEAGARAYLDTLRKSHRYQRDVY